MILSEYCLIALLSLRTVMESTRRAESVRSCYDNRWWSYMQGDTEGSHLTGFFLVFSSYVLWPKLSIF